MPDSNHYIPEELVTQILVRLAVKPLLRCKSVSKLWLSIITNPGFTKTHLNFSLIASKTNPTLLVIEYPLTKNPPPTQPEPVISDAELQQLQRHELVALGYMDEFHVRFSRVFAPRDRHVIYYVGTCNGIICMTTIFGHAIYLWNPSIKMWKTVCAPSRVTHNCRMGFGYDCILDDYKVVRILYGDLEDDDDYDVPTVVQVYSTNGGCWRQFQNPVLKPYLIQPSGGVDAVVNGVLYMDCFDKLVSFDFYKEVFGLVLFPKSIKIMRSDVLDYQGSVAMVFESVGGQVDLWTLDDVSGEIPWTKRFSVKDDSELWLTGYLGAGYFLGRISSDQSSYLYDYEKKQVNRFYRRTDNNVYATLKYTESLVSFDGFEQVQ